MSDETTPGVIMGMQKESPTLLDALYAFFNEPINEHGTPYVSMPMDFTIAEQEEFCSLVRRDSFVSRNEQIKLLQDILARRSMR